jgi:cytochrome c
MKAVLLTALLGVGLTAAAAQNPANPGNSANLSNPGNPEKGKAVFDKCAACHALDDTMADGPSLKGVFGRKAGTRDDYRYSAAMVRSGVVWDEMTIDAYVTDPQAFIRGNRMSFAGIPSKADRDDLIAYLAQATKPRYDLRI